MIGGLSWNEEGNPAYCCLVSRKTSSRENTMDEQIDYLEVLKELQADSLSALLEKLQVENNLTAIYAQKGYKYNTYIRDFNIWRRDNKPALQLKASTVSSFEAGILRIRDLINKKKIKFPEDSTVLSQLRVFSKLSLKSEVDFYAISALTNVINAYRNNSNPFIETVPKLSSWY